MRPKTITITISATDADGVCQSQTPAAGGAQSLTINGALAASGVATFTQPRHVSITSDGNDSGRTFTVTGTDRNGLALTETITGPNTTTVNGTKNFKTVTAVSVDDDTAGAITVGDADELETQWYPHNYVCPEFNVGMHLQMSSSADFTWSLEHTLAHVQATDFDEHDADPFTDGVVNEVGSGSTSVTKRVTASRIKVVDHTSGNFDWRITQ